MSTFVITSALNQMTQSIESQELEEAEMEMDIIQKELGLPESSNYSKDTHQYPVISSKYLVSSLQIANPDL